MNLIDLLSPDFKIKTLTEIPGTSSRGILESNVELKSYYLEETRRGKTLIENIYKFAEGIYSLYTENLYFLVKESIDKDKFIYLLIGDLYDSSLGYSDFIGSIDITGRLNHIFNHLTIFEPNDFILEHYPNIHAFNVGDDNMLNDFVSLLINNKDKYDLTDEYDVNLFKILSFDDTKDFYNYDLYTIFFENNQELLVLINGYHDIHEFDTKIYDLYREYLSPLIMKMGSDFNSIIDLYNYQKYYWKYDDDDEDEDEDN